MYRNFFKRLIDIILSLIGLIILFPFFIAVYISILINMGRPVFFLQPRPGLNCQIFKIIKFRSMRNAHDKHGNLLKDAQRITPLGAFIRKTSLDEIPQLINVLKGDMSIVGPRPLAAKYLPYYTETENLRHTVRPGITGLAQVSGRNALSWDDKLKLDVEYVNNLSFWLDITIIFKTVIKTVRRENMSATGIDSPGDFDEYRKKQLNV